MSMSLRAQGPYEPSACQLEAAADGDLTLTTPDGHQHHQVAVIRAFPLSATDGPVAVVGRDGRELLWIASLATAPADLHRLLIDQLAADEFLPRIEAIETITRHEPSTWQVRTDRGLHRFELAASDAVIWHADGGVTITDRDGICYVVPAVHQLDRRSRRLLERHG